MFVAETSTISHTIGTMASSRGLQSWWWTKQGLDGSLRGAGGGLSDMPGNAIVDCGRAVGLWEYDQPRAEVVYVSFSGKSRPMEVAVGESEKYIREDLGDARTFSIDSPKSRAAKMQQLRKEAAL